VILKATSFLEGHKRDMGMTFRITGINSFNRSCTVSSLRFTGSCPDFKTRIR